ncbi:MAG TPA: hypothetical protein VM452_09245 [Caulifigura sp.]|jgi:hypothetical protein|nr:hypothetical protein [Caulifigura sp.]
MRIPGRRITRHRLIQTDRLVIDVSVELVYPEDDPSKPCYESETVELLKEVQARAEKLDIAWLRKHGKVYEATEA